MCRLFYTTNSKGHNILFYFTGDHLQGSVFVRLQLACESPIQFSYYTSKVGRTDVCCHCGGVNAEQDKELLKQYRTVLPICKSRTCVAKGALKRCPIK